MDENKKLIEYTNELYDMSFLKGDERKTEIFHIVQQIFQMGYEIGSQETATELGKQVEQQLKQAFKRF